MTDKVKKTETPTTDSAEKAGNIPWLQRVYDTIAGTTQNSATLERLELVRLWFPRIEASDEMRRSVVAGIYYACFEMLGSALQLTRDEHTALYQAAGVWRRSVREWPHKSEFIRVYPALEDEKTKPMQGLLKRPEQFWVVAVIRTMLEGQSDKPGQLATVEFVLDTTASILKSQKPENGARYAPEVDAWHQLMLDQLERAQRILASVPATEAVPGGLSAMLAALIQRGDKT